MSGLDPLPVLAAPAARLESEVEIKPIAQEWDLQPSAVLNFLTFPAHNFYLMIFVDTRRYL